MTAAEIAHLRNQRLMLLGALSEAPPEEQAKIQACRQEFEALIDRHGELSIVVISLLACEAAIAQGVTE